MSKSKENQKANELTALKVITTLLVPNEEQLLSVAQIKEHSDLTLTAAHIGKYVRMFEESGILTRRYTVVPGVGKSSYWTLLMDPISARSTLLASQEARDQDEPRPGKSRGGTGKPVGRPRKVSPTEIPIEPEPGWDGQLALASDEKEEVKAIAGPDAPTLADVMPKEVRNLRKSEPGALIEAARQYQNRTTVAKAKFTELVKSMSELGVTIDESKLNELFKFETDERMETIVPLLPYIDQIEDRNTRLIETVDHLTTQNKELAAKAAKYDTTKADNDRLTRRVETLVSQRTMAQA